MTLKHKNTSRWVKHALTQKNNKGLQQAVSEQLARGEELRRKQARMHEPNPGPSPSPNPSPNSNPNPIPYPNPNPDQAWSTIAAQCSALESMWM